MAFKKVFRGYDPKEVDNHINALTQKHEQIRLAQKQYMEELTEENFQLRQQVKQYQADEQTIAKSLVDSQKLADELKNDAEHFSDLVLTRAKVFYATWRVYSQTLVATLDEQEVIQFNKILAKIEGIINAYEGKNIQEESQNIVKCAQQMDDEQQQTVATAQAVEPAETPDLAPTGKTMGVYANPIGKVEEAMENAIDLRELTNVDQSLEQLCQELGLIPPTKPE